MAGSSEDVALQLCPSQTFSKTFLRRCFAVGLRAR